MDIAIISVCARKRHQITTKNCQSLDRPAANSCVVFGTVRIEG